MKEICNTKKLFSDDKYIYTLISERPIQNKEKVLKYLKSGEVMACAAGIARDMLTGETIEGELLGLTDGEYVWRSDFIYYFEKYNMRLSDEFIKHVEEMVA